MWTAVIFASCLSLLSSSYTSSLIFLSHLFFHHCFFSFFVSLWCLVQDYCQEDKEQCVLKDFWFLKLCISFLIVCLIDWSIDLFIQIRMFHTTGSSLILPGKKAHLDMVLLKFSQTYSSSSWDVWYILSFCLAEPKDVSSLLVHCTQPWPISKTN